MRGAVKRWEYEAESRNRQSYNTAALSGGAFAGELPAYDQVFGRGAVFEQSDEVIAANIRLWAAQMGLRAQSIPSGQYSTSSISRAAMNADR